jgi:hypothetical protein
MVMTKGTIIHKKSVAIAGVINRRGKKRFMVLAQRGVNVGNHKKTI